MSNEYFNVDIIYTDTIMLLVGLLCFKLYLYFGTYVFAVY